MWFSDQQRSKALIFKSLYIYIPVGSWSCKIGLSLENIYDQQYNKQFPNSFIVAQHCIHHTRVYQFKHNLQKFLQKNKSKGLNKSKHPKILSSFTASKYV